MFRLVPLLIVWASAVASARANTSCPTSPLNDALSKSAVDGHDFEINLTHALLNPEDGLIPGITYAVTISVAGGDTERYFNGFLITVTDGNGSFVGELQKEVPVTVDFNQTQQNFGSLDVHFCSQPKAIAWLLPSAEYVVSAVNLRWRMALGQNINITAFFYENGIWYKKSTLYSQFKGCVQRITSAHGLISELDLILDTESCSQTIVALSVNDPHLPINDFYQRILQFQSLNFLNNDCSRDYLEVVWSTSFSFDNWNVKRICGAQMDTRSLSRLRFTSQSEPILLRGSIADGSRFKAAYYTLDRRKGCNVTLTSFEGVISSPNYPKSYFPGLDCYYHLKVGKEQRAVLKLKFLQLHQRPDGSCSADFVQLLTSPNRKIRRKYCGASLQRYHRQYTTLFASEDVVIHFHSDWLGGGKGFSMEFAVSKACGEELHTLAEDTLFLLKDDVKPKAQGSNWDDCFTSVHVPYGFVAHLTVTSFTTDELEESPKTISQLAPAFHRVQDDADEIMNKQWSGCVEGSVEVIEKDGNWVLCDVQSWDNVSLTTKSNHALVRVTRDRSAKVRKVIKISYRAVPIERSIGDCVYGWSWNDGSCYLAVRKRMSWLNAENYCQQFDGGHLVSILSHSQQLFVNKLVEHSVFDDEIKGIWIGGNDRKFENGYEWSDGQPVVYTNWFKGWPLYGYYGWQPSDDGMSDEDCVEMRKLFLYPTKGSGETDTYYWNDRDCSLLNPFICQSTLKKTVAPADKNCNRTVKLSLLHPAELISTPSYPQLYPNDADCTTWIIAPRGTRISAIFKTFHLEDGPSCEYDYVELISDGKLSKRVCGYWKDKIKLLRHVSNNHQMQIHFVSDHSHAFRGFQAKVSIEEGGETCENERMIRFERNCYLIVPHPLVTWTTAQQICNELKANLVKVQSKEEEKFLLNHLAPFTPSVFPSVATFWLGVIKFHTASSTSTFYSSDLSTPEVKGKSHLCVSFQGLRDTFDLHTGNCDEFRGYICQKSIKENELNLNKTIRGNSGIVTSPEFPSNYPNNIDYTLKLVGQPWTRLILTLTALDIEWQKDCLYDYLGVKSNEDDDLVRLCGSEAHKDDQWRYISNHNVMYLTFHSDFSISGAGFSANWKAIDVSGCPVKTLRSTAATIISPNYPEPYLNSMSCTTQVETGNQGKWVWMQFNSFWVGTGKGGSLHKETCLDDQLVIKTKDDNSGQLDLCLCGQLDFQLPNLAFVAMTSMFEISFSSGQNTKANGYEMTFNTVDDLYFQRVIPVKGNSTGFIYHLNYPNQSPPYLDYKRKLVLPLAHIFNFHLEGYSPANSHNNSLCEQWSIEIKDPYGSSRKLCKSSNDFVAEEFIFKSAFNIILIHEISGYLEDPLNNFYKISYTSVSDPLFKTKSMDEDLRIESCEPNPCINGGSCTQLKDRNHCACNGHFTGIFCHLTVCELNPCFHGLCNLTSNGYQCHCHAGYSGQRCESRINPCSPNPCGTRGLCYPDNKGSFHCRCHIWWQGPICENKAQHIPYKPLSQRMLEEPFWLGLITVFSVLAFLGFVWCIKRKFADKIERFLTEELDKSQKGGKKHSLRDGGSPVSLSPHLGPRGLLGRIGLRKHSMLSLDSSESISPNCHENRSFSLADIGRKSDSQKRLDKLRIQHSESSPAPLDKKELLQSLVTPTSARSRRMSLDEFFQMSERKILERNNSRGDNMSDCDSASNEETSLDIGLKGAFRRTHFVRTLEKIDSVSFENERDEDQAMMSECLNGCSSRGIESNGIKIGLLKEELSAMPPKFDYSDGSSLEVDSCGSHEVPNGKSEVYVEVHAAPKKSCERNHEPPGILVPHSKLKTELKPISRIAPIKIMTVNRSEISSPNLNLKTASWDRPGSPTAMPINMSGFKPPQIEITFNHSISPKRKMFHEVQKTSSLDLPTPLITITTNTSSCESDMDSPVKTQVQMNYLSPFDILRQDSSERSTSLSNLSSSGYSSMTSPGPSRCNSNSPLFYGENDASPAHRPHHSASPRHSPLGMALTKTVPFNQVRPPLLRSTAVVRKRSDSETTDEHPEASLPDSDEGIGMDHIDVKIHRGELTSAKDLAMYMDYSVRQNGGLSEEAKNKMETLDVGNNQAEGLHAGMITPAIVVQSLHQTELDMVKCWKFVRRKSFQRKLSPVSSRSESPLSDRGPPPNEKYSSLFYPNDNGSISTDSDELYDNQQLSSPESTPATLVTPKFLAEPKVSQPLLSQRKRKNNRNCSKVKQNNYKGAYKRVSCNASPKKVPSRMSVEIDSSADESSVSSEEFVVHQANGYASSGHDVSEDDVFDVLSPLPVVVTCVDDDDAQIDNQMDGFLDVQKPNNIIGKHNCSVNGCEQSDETDEEVMVVEVTKGR